MPAPGPTSLLDRVDDTDEPIGVIARQDVFREHAGFRVVHVFAFNDRGDLLLQRLASARDRSPGKWGSSVAGYLHAGESYAAAARRRLAEELGVSSPIDKLGSTRMHDAGATKFIELFETRAAAARIADPTQVAELAFVSLTDVQRRMAEAPEQFTETFPHVLRLYEAVTGGR